MSVRKNDPGYHKKAQYFQPYLNDQKLSHCFTADEDQSKIDREQP